MKVALYARVSTDRQETANQVPALKRYVEARGWEYELLEEEESTRKTRPVKESVLRRLRAGELDGVVVWKLDRWGRSTSELVRELSEIQERGLLFASVTDNIDLSTATGKLQLGILAAFAQFERDLTSERTREALARKKAAGAKLGRPKGSKDKKQRRKSGYYLRHAGKKGGSAK